MAKDSDTVYSINKQELIYTLINIFIELSKIVVSSLLVVFVPQNCNGETCSLYENFTDLTEINKAALGWNFITLGFMLILYVVMYKREKFLIYRLDEDPQVAPINIREVFRTNPEIENGVYMHNSRLKWAGISTCLIYLVNVILSAILIFRDYYDGYQSVIQFIINAALCYYLVFRSIYHSLTTERSGLVISNIHFIPLIYNQIDREYKGKLTNITII
jgi:hypothetical protein